MEATACAILPFKVILRLSETVGVILYSSPSTTTVERLQLILLQFETRTFFYGHPVLSDAVLSTEF